MKDDIVIRARQQPWSNAVELLVMTEDQRFIGKPVELEEHSNEAMIIDPTARITKQQAQVLIDDLWAAGLRPTEGAGSAGQLAATERHLEDMRKLVFKPQPPTN